MHAEEYVLAKELSLPPVKIHCSLLAEDAVKAAVHDYASSRLLKGINVEVLMELSIEQGNAMAALLLL